jgi:hypothetical protein
MFRDAARGKKPGGGKKKKNKRQALQQGAIDSAEFADGIQKIRMSASA